MADLLVPGLEIAVLLAGVLPFARVWLQPGFRRKLVVFPATAVQIVAATVLVAGGAILVCLLVPHGLTLTEAAAVPLIAWERWRARPGHGRARGLPPGSLALAPVGPWRDERFYERQAARHGPIFKTSNYVKPMVCVVGLERGLRLLRAHDTDLGHIPLPFSRRIPRGFLRYMDAESHRRYRPLLAAAISRDALREAERFVRAQIRSTLAELERAPGRSPEAALRSLSSTILVRLTLGLEPDDPGHEPVCRLLHETDHLRALWRRDRRVERALVALTDVIGSQTRDGRRGPTHPRCSFASELGRAARDAEADATALRNLAYVLQTGSHDAGGLFTWLVKMLADHPRWAAIVRAEETSGPSGRTTTDAAERVVLETLRLRQSEYLARRATRTFAFDGYTIPAGWLIRVCVRESHRDPSVFAAPDTFDPDRFLAGRPQRSEYSPFGAPPATCLGSYLTQSLGALLVRELASRYDIRTVADGAIAFGPFHWRPSPAFRVELSPTGAPVEPEANGQRRTENRTPVAAGGP